ncbi:Hypothetical protein A7982_02373 [Minicystis rosea]|nr:Hypothetical protein A7982_02373 [Minicystis rosea]
MPLGRPRSAPSRRVLADVARVELEGRRLDPFLGSLIS